MSSISEGADDRWDLVGIQSVTTDFFDLKSEPTLFLDFSSSNMVNYLLHAVVQGIEEQRRLPRSEACFASGGQTMPMHHLVFQDVTDQATSQV